MAKLYLLFSNERGKEHDLSNPRTTTMSAGCKPSCSHPSSMTGMKLADH